MQCQYCQSEFLAKKSNAKYCSRKCGRMANYYNNYERSRELAHKYHCKRYVKKPRHLWNRPMPMDKKLLRRKSYEKIKSNPVEYAKQLARITAMNAFLNGKIEVAPCKCGETKVQMHHCDYNKPLDIVWMCVKCHFAWHKENQAIDPVVSVKAP